MAMSGGVDSAVAALLVSDAGEDAVAVTLELWSDPEGDGELSCCSAQAVRGARALAHELGIPHFSIDLREEFRAGVVDGWLQAHREGLTPNPCVPATVTCGSTRCSSWHSGSARQTLATGHYARVSEARASVQMACDERKDQSYVLSALSAGSLARMRFPLGGLQKTEVRELAERAGLAVARRRDSQDLCFLAGTGQERFLLRHADLGRRPGPIIDAAGCRARPAPGAPPLTVGQRHGLGLSGREPLYVLGTDPATNTVTVGPRPALLTTSCRCGS